MTGNIRILLAQIATFEAQHKAGLTPPVTALAEFFDTARLAKLDVESFDRGMVQPSDREVPSLSAPLQRYDEEMVALITRMPLPLLTRAVILKLETNTAAGGAAPKRIVIGGGPCGA